MPRNTLTSSCLSDADGRSLRAPRWGGLGFGLSTSQPVQALFTRQEACTPPSSDMHYPVEVGLVLSGRMRRSLGDWTADLGPAQAWLCGTWEPHGWEVVEAPCEHLVFLALPEVLLAALPDGASHGDLLSLFTAPPELRPQARDGTRQELLALVRTVQTRLSLAGPLRGLWMQFLLLDVLFILRRGWRSSTPVESPRGGPADVVRQALEVIFRRRGLVSVDEAAHRCGVSRSTLERACTRLMGVPFARLALRHRLHQAAAQLAQTSDPVKAVALEWGFAGPGHLQRCFRRHYGCSPGRYRRSYGGHGGS